MTIPEAVRLVLQAAAIAQSGQVMVLDMGEPVKIVELARQMIRMSGHREDEIRIVFAGLRPGEKLYEELLADADQTVATGHLRLRIAKLNDDGGRALALQLQTAGVALADADAAREWLSRVVPEFDQRSRAGAALKP